MSRTLYLEVGGLDEGLRYERDRDFFLRAIDRARLIRFLPQMVSRHNIPDPAAAASMSISESELSKRLYQLRVCDKAILLSVGADLRRYAMRNRIYVLQHISQEAIRAGRRDCAQYYRREALVTKLGLRWASVKRALGGGYC